MMERWGLIFNSINYSISRKLKKNGVRFHLAFLQQMPPEIIVALTDRNTEKPQKNINVWHRARHGFLLNFFLIFYFIKNNFPLLITRRQLLDKSGKFFCIN